MSGGLTLKDGLESDPAVTVMDVRRRIDEAAVRAGRNPATIELMLATKTQSVSRILQAAQAMSDEGPGIALFGENRAREGRLKAEALSQNTIRWAMIGHIQSNKIDDVLAFADEIHSLDRLRLAEILDRRLQQQGRGLDVYIQVNTSGETSKFGLRPIEVKPFLRELTAFASLRVRGFMTLATHSEDAAAVRRCFQILRELRDRARANAPQGAALDGLSMGMSNDFELAVEEGATVVRVGEAIFGQRSETPPMGWWPQAATARPATGLQDTSSMTE
jgi:PLP dependent protein